ncbi:MAG: ABC transporter ATP-binding protein [Candidatus Omnitrophota bacterium]
MESRAVGSGRSDKIRMIISENINKIFKQGKKNVTAVESASLKIEKGRRVYIHGPSGAGKSTFLHILGGLSSPTSGKVLCQGKDLYKLSDKKRSLLRNRYFGFIFQFYHLLPELNVLENVILPAMIRSSRMDKSVRERADNLLSRVGMSHRLKHKPSQLSGGEIQRTAIARALINSPEILFCDEPTGNLDSKMSEEIYSLIYSVSIDQKMSVVVVSHQKLKKDFFHEEYVMEDGILKGEKYGA